MPDNDARDIRDVLYSAWAVGLLILSATMGMLNLAFAWLIYTGALAGKPEGHTLVYPCKQFNYAIACGVLLLATFIFLLRATSQKKRSMMIVGSIVIIVIMVAEGVLMDN